MCYYNSPQTMNGRDDENENENENDDCNTR